MPHVKIRTPLKSIVATRPLQILAIDFTVLEKASNGQENVLVMTDVFTKFTVAVPTKDQKATTTARALVREWFLKYGVPVCVHSDQGRNFLSSLMNELYRSYQITKSQTTPYNPKGNGQVERYNRTLHDLLRTLPVEQKRRWPEHLPEVVYAYNATPHATTGFSPFFLMFGRDAKLPVDMLFGEPNDGTDSDSWVAKHRKRLNAAYSRALENIEMAAHNRKERYDKKASPSIIEVGERVYLRNRGLKGRQKIQDAFGSDVYVIVKRDDHVYTVEALDGSGRVKVVNRAEIKPCPKAVGHDPSHSSAPRSPTRETDPSESDRFIQLTFPQPEVVNRRSSSSEITSSDSSDSDPPVERPVLRRSTRRTAGHHSNPYRLPRTVLSRRQSIRVTRH